MNFCVYDDCTWLYPDSPLAGPQAARLDAPRGGHAAFQLLVDKGGECRLTFDWKTPGGPPVSLYREREHRPHPDDHHRLRRLPGLCDPRRTL